MLRIIKSVFKSILPQSLSDDLRKYYIRHKLEDGVYDQEEKEMDLLKYLVKPGDIAIDLGANIGAYTRLLSKLTSHNGAVYAFEPLPITYSYLLFNINLHSYTNVVTYNAAIGDQVGLCTVVLPNLGSEDIYQAGIMNAESDKGKIFTVPMLTLDSLSPNCFDKIDFIKCDIEGAEQLAFKGGENAIRKNRPKIICEISAEGLQPGSSDITFFNLLYDYGYNSFFYDGQNIVSCKFKDSRNGNANYIFIHSSDSDADSIIKDINGF